VATPLEQYEDERPDDRADRQEALREAQARNRRPGAAPSDASVGNADHKRDAPNPTAEALKASEESPEAPTGEQELSSVESSASSPSGEEEDEANSAPARSSASKAAGRTRQRRPSARGQGLSLVDDVAESSVSDTQSSPTEPVTDRVRVSRRKPVLPAAAGPGSAEDGRTALRGALASTTGLRQPRLTSKKGADPKS
jgi:hypothetical protein